MADPPRLTKLGAKWVDVRNGGLKASVVADESVLKTWPATPVKYRSLQAGLSLDLSKCFCKTKGAAGVDQPSEV